MSQQSTTTETKQKWGAYICPSCNSVFRLITSSNAQASRCPNCADYLHITPRSESTPAQWNPNQQLLSKQSQHLSDTTPHSTDPTNKTKGPRRRKQKKKNNHTSTQWDSAQEQPSSSRSTSAKPWIIVFFLSLLSIASPLFLLAKKNEINKIHTQLSNPTNFRKITSSEFNSSVGLNKSIEESKTQNIRAINESTELCTQAVTLFLEASTIDDMLPLIHDRERLEPLIRRYYKKNSYKKRGFKEILIKQGSRISGNFYTFRVVTSDYKTDSIVCVDQGNDTFLVDWESWIGYGDLTQAELRKQKPTRPTAIRALVKKTNYYNFQFSDDSQWQAYQISTKDSDDILYGYVLSSSAAHLELASFVSEKKVTALQLKIRYPKANKRASQVIIDSVISNGWVKK